LSSDTKVVCALASDSLPHFLIDRSAASPWIYITKIVRGFLLLTNPGAWRHVAVLDFVDGKFASGEEHAVGVATGGVNPTELIIQFYTHLT
jgi:hypothetical protein